MPELSEYSRTRAVCWNCRKERVYALAPAERLDLCEPCYWAWQDLGSPSVFKSKVAKRRVFRSRWEKRGSGGN